LPLHAAASREKGSSAYELDEATAEAVLAAPSGWCPNPDQTICLRVIGDSMEPLLQAGYSVVVDRKQNDLKSLQGKIVVVQHKDFGLAVSRLFRLEGRHMLVSDNRVYDPMAFDAGWRITGRVLWWVGGPMIAAEKRVP
jgi:phage repressor protein C with HTH and peptisase S24 domain